jgi:ferredoxin--NADP+ reductase
MGQWFSVRQRPDTMLESLIRRIKTCQDTIRVAQFLPFALEERPKGGWVLPIPAKARQSNCGLLFLDPAAASYSEGTALSGAGRNDYGDHDMQLSDYKPGTKFEGTVVENTPITPPNAKEEVRHIVLSLSNDAPSFVEGQSLGVHVPGPLPFGEKEHMRFYSVASSRLGEDGDSETISLCVRRCFYIDEVSGEKYKGVASNYLCDLRPGAKVPMSGPYEHAFKLPKDDTVNLLMIALGTGIAPFRAFVKHIYDTVGGWRGKVRLFFGARTGLEMLYMNDLKNDLSLYYEQKTFKAFEAVSPRPALEEPAAIDRTLEENADEVWGMLQEPNTYVYVAGVKAISKQLDRAFSKMAGSQEAWRKKKVGLESVGRWNELLY